MKVIIGLIRETCSDISSSIFYPLMSVLLCLASIIPHQSTPYSMGYDDSIHHFWLSIVFTAILCFPLSMAAEILTKALDKVLNSSEKWT